MAVPVDPARVHAFPDAESFYRWLGGHHASEPEVWIRIYKVASGVPTITPVEAIDVALCWGWIDAIRKGLDDRSATSSATRRAAGGASGAGSTSTTSPGWSPRAG